MSKPILAIMQNQWFKDPERVEKMIVHGVSVYGEPYRRRFIERALFAGCLSGRRIRAEFPETVLEQMEWDEASRVISGHASHAPEPDQQHVNRVILDVCPRMVVTFGVIANRAVREVWAGPTVVCCHPAARGADVPVSLRRAGVELETFLRTLTP